MKYQVHYIAVGDADAIVLYYKENDYSESKLVLIDAGNVGDAGTIKKYIHDHFNTYKIDIAICTHPDKDHKGGFFGLLEDPQVEIVNFYLKDPWAYLDVDNFDNVDDEEEACLISRSVFAHPQDGSKNLIDLAIDNCTGEFCNLEDGFEFDEIPLQVVGPSEEYYGEVVIDMINNFSELNDEADFENYDESALPSDEDAKSVIDEDDDTSDTNRSSIMLLFTPGNNRYLFLGDATCASIADSMQRHDLTDCKVKIPHHGSKHNMTTVIIDALKPVQSIISAKGSKKHPNSGLVYWLSKYGNVYSTHKSGSLYYTSEPTKHSAIPLKKKQ